MKTKEKSSVQDKHSLYVCKQCDRKLPKEAFYVNKQTQCPDKYCKECRKIISRSRYNSGNWIRKKQSAKSPYPVITEIKDPKERMTLILNALQVVRQSVERKRTRIREEEENRIDNL